MNCEQFKTVVHAIARDESMDTDALEVALKHAHDCDECNESLEEAESLTADLRLLAGHYAAEESSQRVENELMHRFEQKKRLASRSGIFRFVSLAATGSIAAAGFWIFVMLHKAPTRNQVSFPGADRAKIPALNRSGATVIPAQGEAFAAVDASAYSQDVWMSALNNNAGAPEAFVPLTETFDSGSVNAENVVRVAMSRSALSRLGLYLDQASEGGDEQVVADLVVSGDGTPQAIRVVNW